MNIPKGDIPFIKQYPEPAMMIDSIAGNMNICVADNATFSN
jgi:hypothetical protein